LTDRGTYLAFKDKLSLVPLVEGDPELYEIIGRTLLITWVATLLASLVGIPLGYALARGEFRGRTLLLSAVNTGMGMPPVVVGLVVWLLLTRSGPLGSLNLIYTKRAMVLAQFVIATPLVVGFTAASVQSLPAELPDLLNVLGASRIRRLWIMAVEAELGLLAAVMAGFGAVISEVGASMTVGGNLRGSTRVLTTAIVTETGRGNLPFAFALGILLLILACGVNLLLTIVQQRQRN
jgi:tungstate transport system permease protein